MPWRPDASPKEKFESLFSETIKLGRNSNDRTDLSHLDNYLKMLWRLSLGSPIEYLGTHPFDFTGSSNLEFYKLSNKPKGGAERVEVARESSIRSALGLEAGTKDPLANFSVFIDGVQLFRPVRLAEELQGSRDLPCPLLFAGKVETSFGEAVAERSGGRLSFEAYLYWNSKIIPKESIGALLRVNGASGTLFDPDFLGYQIAEQTRKKQITCEIYVLEGLDGALNIDRESYNTSHPHYLFIQKWLHNAFRQFATQHKRIGREIRDKQKASLEQEASSKLSDFTGEVWERMRGHDLALPSLEIDRADDGVSLPVKIGGNPIFWDQPRIDRKKFRRSDRIEAITITLDAYGILEILDEERRADLIFDIISIFEDDE